MISPTATPAGIHCGAICAVTFSYGSAVTLTATPGAGSTFAGWSGACGGAEACGLVVTQGATLTATFNVVPPVFKLYLPMVTRGAGTGGSQGARGGVEARGAIWVKVVRRRGREAKEGLTSQLAERPFARMPAHIIERLRLRSG